MTARGRSEIEKRDSVRGGRNGAVASWRGSRARVGGAVSRVSAGPGTGDRDTRVSEVPQPGRALVGGQDV